MHTYTNTRPDLAAPAAEKLAVATNAGSSVTLAAGPRANALVKLAVSGQVLEVTDGGGPAFGRLRDSGGTTDSVDSAAYCVQGADCTCPDGSPGAGEQLPPIAAGIAWGAVTGNVQATQVTFTRTTTATWCQHPVGGSPRTGSGALTVAGAATGSSFDHGANDSCTIHQQSTFPPGVQLQCFFEIAEPGTSAIASSRSPRFTTRASAPMRSPTAGTPPAPTSTSPT